MPDPKKFPQKEPLVIASAKFFTTCPSCHPKVSEVTYNVSSGTLNSSIPYHTITQPTVSKVVKYSQFCCVHS